MMRSSVRIRVRANFCRHFLMIMRSSIGQFLLLLFVYRVTRANVGEATERRGVWGTFSWHFRPGVAALVRPLVNCTKQVKANTITRNIYTFIHSPHIGKRCHHGLNTKKPRNWFRVNLFFLSKQLPVTGSARVMEHPSHGFYLGSYNGNNQHEETLLSSTKQTTSLHVIVNTRDQAVTDGRPGGIDVIHFWSFPMPSRTCSHM